MKISELLEGRTVDDLADYIGNDDHDENGVNFDLSEDLVHFMMHDDDMYRNHVYPSVAAAGHARKHGADFNHKHLKNSVAGAYVKYKHKFPVKGLPDTLDPELHEEICKKLHDSIIAHFDEE